MKKYISLCSILLFVIPIVTLLICLQIHVLYYDLQSIPFIDGKVSISLIGRQEKTIAIFKSGLFLYSIVSIFFYFKISEFFLSKGIKNKFKIFGILVNFFLCIYLLALGKQEFFYETSRRLAIIFFIATMYINHVYLIKVLILLKSINKIEFNITYSMIFYTIIIVMTILVIIGLPWVNPLFKYPDQLKNIIEWNLLFLTVTFYIPLSFLYYQLEKKVKK